MARRWTPQFVVDIHWHRPAAPTEPVSSVAGHRHRRRRRTLLRSHEPRVTHRTLAAFVVRVMPAGVCRHDHAAATDVDQPAAALDRTASSASRTANRCFAAAKLIDPPRPARRVAAISGIGLVGAAARAPRRPRRRARRWPAGTVPTEWLLRSTWLEAHEARGAIQDSIQVFRRHMAVSDGTRRTTDRRNPSSRHMSVPKGSTALDS